MPEENKNEMLNITTFESITNKNILHHYRNTEGTAIFRSLTTENLGEIEAMEKPEKLIPPKPKLDLASHSAPTAKLLSMSHLSVPHLIKSEPHKVIHIADYSRESSTLPSMDFSSLPEIPGTTGHATGLSSLFLMNEQSEITSQVMYEGTSMRLNSFGSVQSIIEKSEFMMYCEKYMNDPEVKAVIKQINQIYEAKEKAVAATMDYLDTDYIITSSSSIESSILGSLLPPKSGPSIDGKESDVSTELPSFSSSIIESILASQEEKEAVASVDYLKTDADFTDISGELVIVEY